MQRITMQQQPLIAVRQGEHPAPPGDQPLQTAGARIGAVQREAKISRLAGVVADMPGRSVTPARRQARVRVQQQQPIAGSRRDSRRELPSPSARPDHHDGTRGVPDRRRSIAAPAVGEHDFRDLAKRAMVAGSVAVGVQGWDDDGYVSRFVLDGPIQVRDGVPREHTGNGPCRNSRTRTRTQTRMPSPRCTGPACRTRNRSRACPPAPGAAAARSTIRRSVSSPRWSARSTTAGTP